MSAASSTAAEETVNPKRNLPLGILGGLGICTLIYVIVYVPGAGLTGWGFIWVIIALLLDIGHWGASYTQRNQIPGVQGR